MSPGRASQCRSVVPSCESTLPVSENTEAAGTRMSARVLETDRTGIPPDQFLRRVGEIFEDFDERRQDSGNVSYGVRFGDLRVFAKTAGRPSVGTPLSHPERVALLRVLGALGNADERAVKPLAHLAHDPSPAVSRAALEALGRIGSVAATARSSLIGVVIQTADEETRRAALAML
ncbi:MAG: HEAT repeat domain-containing protein [Lysobacterales bacterium]|nr:MAG: HEAT repeat domain-containing protein [Xanthomonadales bacterium]